MTTSPQRPCNCAEAPGCAHVSVPEQRPAEAVFGSRADPDKPCYHPEFDVHTAIGRIGQGDDDNPAPGMPVHFVAEIQINCSACGERFRFEGLPAGMSYSAPAVSVDRFELRAPIRPEQAPPAFPRKGAVTGFQIKLRHDDGRPR